MIRPPSSRIAAVTRALRARLDRSANAVLPGATVSVRPPDKARVQAGIHQVNLFLYQTKPNAAWRNVAPRPVLALDLHYLLSVYGANDDDPEPTSHVLLESAMRELQEQPVIREEELGSSLDDPPPSLQGERIVLTQQPLSFDEMSKLWTICQSPYRLSVVYEASVVLIWGEAPGGALGDLAR